jgi:hypothetical protein
MRLVVPTVLSMVSLGVGFTVRSEIRLMPGSAPYKAMVVQSPVAKRLARSVYN